MKIVDIIMCVLLVLGGINWGLVGAFDIDLVATLFGPGSMISRLIYILVGLSAIYHIFQWKCSSMGCCKK